LEKATSLARQGARFGVHSEAAPDTSLILSRNSCDGSLGKTPAWSMSKSVLKAINAANERTLTNCQFFPDATEHALSMPVSRTGPYISKTLRCYKRETLRKPLFSQGVLQWEPCFGTGVASRSTAVIVDPSATAGTQSNSASPARMQSVIISRKFTALS
jgi:hypothetical protein